MGSALAILITLVSVAVVTLPFLRKTPGGIRASSSPLEELQAKRQTVYDNMRLLRLEYELGNISYQEYKETYQVHRREAAEIVRSQELFMDHPEDLESELEKEISRVKRSLNESSLKRDDSC